MISASDVKGLRKLQVLMTKRYKLVNRISPPIMESLFILQENTNNLRKFEEISHENRKKVIYRLETITNQIPFLVVFAINLQFLRIILN